MCPSYNQVHAQLPVGITRVLLNSPVDQAVSVLNAFYSALYAAETLPWQALSTAGLCPPT